MARKTTAAKRTRRNAPPIAEFDREQEFEALRTMLLVRRFEEKAGQLYGMGYIGGFCHLYIGQEAVVTGMFMARRPTDDVITSYRCHGHVLVSGADPKAVMAELTGRMHGVSKGKGGSMHMFHVDGHFWGGHGIVGAQVPLGTGLAFANRYMEDGQATLTFFGEGAANQGQVYESFNMASIWKLPVVYIIENNRYAMGTAVTRSAGREGRGRTGSGARARRQGAVHSGDADLSLSWAFHVRPGQVSHAGGGAEDAPGARSHRAGEEPAAGD